MAVSNTSFSERLVRIERSTPKLFAGDDAPQPFKPQNLVRATGGRSAFFYAAILFGLGVGASVGYFFGLIVGFDIFLTQPPMTVVAIIKADPQMLALTIAMAAGVLLALLCQIFGYTRARALNFWTGYLFGSLAINLQAIYFVYITYFAGAA